jgi:hypothetical protein
MTFDQISFDTSKIIVILFHLLIIRRTSFNLSSLADGDVQEMATSVTDLLKPKRFTVDDVDFLLIRSKLSKSHWLPDDKEFR